MIEIAVGSSENFPFFDLPDSQAVVKLTARYYRELVLRPPATPLNEKSLVLHWIVPEVGAGSGGHRAIGRIIEGLNVRGHRQTVWSDAKLPADLSEIAGDAVIATSWKTAYPASWVTKVRRRFYYVQDFEPAFYAVGGHYFAAEETYRRNFSLITLGPWLKEKLRPYQPNEILSIDAGFDRGAYFADDSSREPERIAFYLRWPTPRRASEQGMAALTRLALFRKNLTVDFFGFPVGDFPAPFHFVDHGMASDGELGRIYRRASVGLVFSATNTSFVPREMMACGLPVVELDTESNRAHFPNGTVSLVPPSPEKIAERIGRLLDQPKLRDDLSRRGLQECGEYTWERTLDQFEFALRKGLNA